MTTCVGLLLFLRIRRGTFPYSVEDDASTTRQTPTIYYSNTCIELTIVTQLSFSERIAIANLYFAVRSKLTGKKESGLLTCQSNQIATSSPAALLWEKKLSAAVVLDSCTVV